MEDGFTKENEHIINIKFKHPLVKYKIKYKDPDDKGKGYSVRKGKEELQGKISAEKRWVIKDKLTALHHHSTVTDCFHRVF